MKSIPNEKRINNQRKKPRYLCCLTAIIAASCLSVAEASTPKKPIAVENTADPRKLSITVDLVHFENFFIRSEITQNGKLLDSKGRWLAPNSDSDESVTTFSVGSDLQNYPDGLYAQIVKVRGQHKNDTNGYEDQHFVYFERKGSNLRRLGMREYSELANPRQEFIDADGSRRIEHLGETAYELGSPDSRVVIPGLMVSSANDPSAKITQSADE